MNKETKDHPNQKEGFEELTQLRVKITDLKHKVFLLEQEEPPEGKEEEQATKIAELEEEIEKLEQEYREHPLAQKDEAERPKDSDK